MQDNDNSTPKGGARDAQIPPRSTTDLSDASDVTLASIVEGDPDDEDIRPAGVPVAATSGKDDELEKDLLDAGLGPHESKASASSFGNEIARLCDRKRALESWLADCVEQLECYVASETSGERASEEGDTVRSALLRVANSLQSETCDPALIDRVTELVSGSAHGRAFVRDSSGLGVVVHAMARHISNPLVQISGCKLLDVVSEDVESVQSVVGSKFEGINAILEAMVEHAESEAVHEAAFGAMRSLCFSEGNRRLLEKHGSVEDLIAAMRQFEHNERVQEHLSEIMGNAVFGNADLRRRCGELGGIRVLAAAMRRFPESANVQGQCCLALRNLSWSCTENCAIMDESGIVTIVLDALKKHSRVPGVQDQGISCLSNVLFQHSTAEIRLKADIKSLLEISLRALKTFPGRQRVVKSAQCMILNIGHTVPLVSAKEELSSILRQPETASIVCRSVGSTDDRTHRTVGNLAMLAKILCPLDEFQVGFRECGGIDLLLSCLGQFVSNRMETAYEVLDGLVAACSGHDESKGVFNAIGGVSKVADLMRDVRLDETFQLKSIILLDNISNGQFEATAEKMTDRTAAMQAVVDGMIAFHHAAKLQEHGCSVMIKVAATSEKDADELCKIGAKPVVEKARSVHSGNHAVESLANQLLLLLVPSDSSREGRGQTPKGSAGARLRSRSRIVQTGQRSRSRMDRSKSREKKRVVGGLTSISEDEQKKRSGRPGATPNKRRHGGKPEKRKQASANIGLESLPE